MIVNNMLIRRGLPVTLVMAATILMQPAPASAGGGYFSLSVGSHYPYHGHRHGHHFRAYRPWPYRPLYGYPYTYAPWPAPYVAVQAPVAWRGGAIDLGVKPKRTQVWVDGAYAGTAGKFDGFPGYLWLEPGRHTLTFYLEGYATFDQVVEVRPGLVTDLRFEMAPLPPGRLATPPSTAPREPPPTPEPRAAPAPTPSPEPPAAPAPTPSPDRPADSPSGPILDLRGDGGSVRLAVEPSDASVYLDGRFVGTAAQLEQLHGGLLVNAGAHVLEVVHPRYVTERLDFRVSPGEELEVVVVLDRSADRS